MTVGQPNLPVTNGSPSSHSTLTRKFSHNFIREGKFVVSKYFFGIVPTTYVYTVGYSKKLFSL
jgi:hypothetical protein